MEPTGPFYIFAEDLCSVLIGPFNTRSEAEAHILFCQERGDAATMEIISDFIRRQIDPANVGLTLSPERDREYEVN